MRFRRAATTGWSGTANGSRVRITLLRASPRTSTPIQKLSSPNNTKPVFRRKFSSIARRVKSPPCASSVRPASSSGARKVSAVRLSSSSLVNSAKARPRVFSDQRSTPFATAAAKASLSFGSGALLATCRRICRAWSNGEPRQSNSHASPAPNRSRQYSSRPPTASVALVRITLGISPKSASRSTGATSIGAECSTACRRFPSRSIQ